MNQLKKQMTQKPSRDDVHEQREPDQSREGVVEKQDAPPEAPSSEPAPCSRQ